MSKEQQHNQEQIDMYERRGKAVSPHTWALAIVIWVLLPFVFILPEPYSTYVAQSQVVAVVIQLMLGAYVVYNYRQASKWIGQEIERLERELEATIAQIEANLTTKEKK